MDSKKFLDQVYYNHDLKKWTPSADSIYGQHLESILEKMADIMGESFQDFRFVLYEHQMHLPLPEFKLTGPDVILIFLSDENSTVPMGICDKFFAIFKSYYPYQENIKNYIAFPIGYSNSAKMTKFIEFDDRKYDASYAGNFFGNRLEFYRQFTWLKYLPPFSIPTRWLKTLYCKVITKLKIFQPRKFVNTFGTSICYWSGGFAKGLSREEYAEIISDTKIALCPKGFRSTECFRLFETMRLGCVIVSDELPPSRWYKNSPIVIESDWLHIQDTIDKLRHDPEKMRSIHQQTIDWWKNVCSDEAVAQYLVDEITRIKSMSVSSE